MSEGPVATAYVEIKPDFDSFGADLRRQTQLASGGFSGLQGSVNGLSRSLKGLGAGAAAAGLQVLQTSLVATTSAVLGLGVAASTIGLKGASSLQALTTRFTALESTLKLNGETVGEFVQSLRDMELNLGISTGSLANAVTRFTSLGLSARQATGLTTVFGDALGTLGMSGGNLDQTLSSIITQLSQAGSVGKFAGDELKSVLENLGGLVSRASLISRISKNTQQAAGDVAKSLNEGTLDFGVGFQALIDELADPKKGLAGALERQADTLPGVITRIKATVRQGLEDAFLPQLVGIADQLSSVLEESGPALAEFSSSIADGFASIAPDVIAALPDIVEGLAFAFQSLAPVVATTATALGMVASAVVDHQAEISAFVSDLGAFVGGLASLFEGLVPILVSNIDNLTTIADILGSIGQILEYLGPLWDILGLAMSFALAPAKIVLEAISILLNLITGDIDGVTNSLSGLGNAAVSVYNQIAAILPLVGQIGSEIGSEAGFKGGGGFASVIPGKAATAAKVPPLILPKFDSVGGGASSGAASAAASAAKTRAAAVKRAIESTTKGAVGIAKKTSEQSAAAIENAFDKLYADLRAAGKQSFIKSAKEIESRLLQVARRRDATIQQLKDATDKLADLKSEALSFNESIRSSILELGNVAEPTQGIATTFLGIRNNLNAAIASASQFGTLIQQLTSAGLNQTSLRQLIEAGPEGGIDAARALASAGAAGIAEVNNLQSQLQSQAVSVSDSITNTFYQAGISAAQGLVAGLQSQEAAIEAQMNRIGDKLVKQLKRALKIQSPSLVLAQEVGVPAGQGIVKGLVASLSDVGGAGSQSVRNYAQNVTFGPGSVVAHGATEAGAARMGNGLGYGIADVIERQMAQAVLNGHG